MNLGENVSALARELGVDRINLYRWRAELIKVPSGEPGVTYDPQQQRIQELEAKIAGLEGTLGHLLVRADGLVAGVEEQFVLADGSADIAAELILIEERPPDAGLVVEPVVGREMVIAVVPEN